MEFGPKLPYQNGNHAAPPETSGAASTRAVKPTVFPAHVRLAGLSAALYGLHRFHIGGAPISRWPVLLLGALALVWATGALPGRWIGVAVWLILLVLFVAYGVRQRRRHYVTFTPSTPPDGGAAPVRPQDKVAGLCHRTALRRGQGARLHLPARLLSHLCHGRTCCALSRRAPSLAGTGRVAAG